MLLTLKKKEKLLMTASIMSTSFCKQMKAGSTYTASSFSMALGSLKKLLQIARAHIYLTVSLN